MEPAIRENRNPDGTFKKGFSGNLSGRPSNTLKDYLKNKFSNMSDEEKEAWLKKHNVPGEIQFRMAEGNPHQTQATEITLPDSLIGIIKQNGTTHTSGGPSVSEKSAT